MSILGWVANWWGAFVFFLCALGCLAWFVRKVYTLADRREGIVGFVASLVLLVFFVIAWYFSATHFVVPIYQRALIIDQTTGKVFKEINEPGLHEIPLIGMDLNYFPTASNYEVCQDFTPSVKGGYEVRVIVCFYMDAGRIDTVAALARYNQKTWGGLWSTWVNQMAPDVAIALSTFTPQELTEKRGDVASAVKKQADALFEREKVPLNRAAFKNWTFTSKPVQDAYDATIASQTLNVQAEARNKAAETDRKTDLYIAETQVQVLTKLVEGWKDQLPKLGIKSEAGVLRWMTLEWLKNTKMPIGSVIVTTDNTTVQPSIPTK